MTVRDQKMERYWDRIIGDWETSSYDSRSRAENLLERIASRFRKHIRHRQETCVKHLDAHLKDCVVVELGCGSGSTC